MELLLSRLISHIKENMTALATVDEDYGQLEAIDNDNVNMYPITFPCVLIDAPKVEWSCIANNSQKGKALLSVKLIIDCYDDTHYDAGTLDAINKRQDMAAQLHKILQGYRPLDDGQLLREESRFYTYNHGIKVYEAIYNLTLTEAIQETVTAEPKALKVRLSLLKD